MNRIGWMVFWMIGIPWMCKCTGVAEDEIKIQPVPSGRNVIFQHEGIPEQVRRFFPRYTNAYISEIDGFDYRQGISVLGDAEVTDKEMIRARDIINIVLLSDPRIRKGLSEYHACIALVQKEPERHSDLEKTLLNGSQRFFDV